MTGQDDAEAGAGIAGRFGFVARAAVYCLLGLLALQFALGGEDQRLDKEGALEAVARQPAGPFLLGAIAVGFAGYAVWRFAEALVGDHQWPKRILYAARGVLYVVFTVTTARVVLGRGAGGGSEEQAKTLSARLLAFSWGRPAVTVLGAGLVILGAVLSWRGAHRTFEKKLRLGEMGAWQRRWLPWLGTVGHAARGAVVAVIGVFLVRAAVQFDPQEAVGVDGALHELARQPYGTVALVAVAIGLAAYGLFSLVEARWRKVLGRP